MPVEADARQQLINTAKLPFIFKHIAVLPDVHMGKGSPIGSVTPHKGAIIPAAVGWAIVVWCERTYTGRAVGRRS
ncbi:RNA-splicing ligase [Escherichia coli]|nr:RNA-splicing ligase [Escherichia coli]